MNKIKFGPQNEREAVAFAMEAFRVDVQHAVQKVMNKKTPEELEKLKDPGGKLGVYIFKLFTEECAVSVRELACIAHALNCDIEIKLVERNA